MSLDESNHKILLEIYFSIELVIQTITILLQQSQEIYLGLEESGWIKVSPMNPNLFLDWRENLIECDHELKLVLLWEGETIAMS